MFCFCLLDSFPFLVYVELFNGQIFFRGITLFIYFFFYGNSVLLLFYSTSLPHSDKYVNFFKIIFNFLLIYRFDVLPPSHPYNFTVFYYYCLISRNCKLNFVLSIDSSLTFQQIFHSTRRINKNSTGIFIS